MFTIETEDGREAPCKPGIIYKYASFLFRILYKKGKVYLCSIDKTDRKTIIGFRNFFD